MPKPPRLPSGAAKLVCVFGWPLSYTRSPAFQTAALRAAGIDAQYAALACPDAAAFRRLFRALAASPQFVGANVTNPYKVEALRLARRLSPAARAIGAVNTLQRQGSAWVGHNTDAEGFLRSAKAGKLALKGRRVLVLGAGGAARAVTWASARAGAASVLVLARRKVQARACAALAGPRGKGAILSLEATSIASRLSDAVIQTLPGEKLGKIYGTSLFKDASGRKWAMDIGYGKTETAFCAGARRRGWKVQDGLPMLMEQGALAFRLWFGRQADRERMRAALRKV